MDSMMGGMKLIDNINQTLRDDLSEEIKTGSKLSIAAACFSIYAVAIIDYILSYMLKLINGVLYPYAFYRINLTVSYVYLIIWLMALLLIYRLCRQHVQEFIEDR